MKAALVVVGVLILGLGSLWLNPFSNVQSPSQSPVKTEIPKAQTILTPPLASPQQIKTSDKKQYFLYGAPDGQNQRLRKKIIFSLPGHGSKAEDDYKAWQPQLMANGNYSLASLNWWDGQGERKENYYSPVEVLREINYFLDTQGYKEGDVVILEGFSRGSANTYAVVANDRSSSKKVIDGVISASGQYQSDFAMTPNLLDQNNGKPFAGIPWVLACGEKDQNPLRDGCLGMRETESFLKDKGANVLALLSDPNGPHGSFHQSPLKLAQKALSLFDNYFK